MGRLMAAGRIKRALVAGSIALPAACAALALSIAPSQAQAQAPAAPAHAAVVAHPGAHHAAVTLQVRIGGKIVSADSAAARRAEPHTDYQMYGTDCNNSPCGEHVFITGNPNNVSIRAVVNCQPSDVYKYGGWHTSVGDESSTAECGNSDEAENGEMQWTMFPNTDFCWLRGESWGRAACS